MATKFVGLDLGTHTVKACEVVTTFRSFELVGYGTEAVDLPAPPKQPASTSGIMALPKPAPLADIEHIAQAARRLLDRRGLEGETVICAIPADWVSTVTLTFPFDQPKKIAQVLPFQLEEAIPFDEDQVVRDYQIIGQTEAGETEVMVAYVRRERFERFLEALDAEGIDPKVVSVGAMSWYNLFDAIYGQAGGTIGLLDLGHTHSELTLFHDGQPTFVRNITGGGREVTAELAELFGVDYLSAERGKLAEGYIGLEEAPEPAEDASRQAVIAAACRRALGAVVREVKRSLAAHELQTGRTTTHVFLTGGTSLLRGLPEYLQSILGVGVSPLDPLAVSFNRLPGDQSHQAPFVGKPLALSMRAFRRKGHQSLLNFRKGPYIYTGDFGFLRGRMISLGVSIGLIIVLAAAVAVTRKRLLEAEAQTIANQTASVAEALGFPTDDAESLRQYMEGRSKRSQQGLPQVSAFEVLYEISKRIDNLDPRLKLDIDQLEIDIERGKLTLKGRTGSGSDVERLVEALQGYKCFENRVTKERVEKTVDERTKFRLTASSSCS